MTGPDVIVASAPGRAGILGNPSDMFGGSVIACAIDRRAYVAIEPASVMRLSALDADLSAEITSPDDLQLAKPPGSQAVARLTPAELSDTRRRTYLNILKAVVIHQRMAGEPVHIRCWSEIPPNAGLSSSSALLVAALRATDTYLGTSPNLHRFAETARDIEYTGMGVTCGFQDFYVTTFGGLLYMDFRDKQDWRGPSVDPFATVETLAGRGDRLPFALANTGLQRDSGETHRPLRARWLDGDVDVRRAIDAIGRLARDGKPFILDGAWDEIVGLMRRNQELIASVGGSGLENDALIDDALGHGARAAKLAGAGHGGTIIALHEDPAALCEALRATGVQLAFPLLHPNSGVRLEDAQAAPAHVTAVGRRRDV